MLLRVVSVVLVVLGLVACAPLEVDPRGIWWDVSRCDALRDGGWWCESRTRPWGALQL